MNNRRVLFAVGIALLGAGCGEDGDHSTYVPDKHKNDYQFASCQFASNEGGDTERVQGPDYRKFLFDKQLDYAKLRAVAKASSEKTVAFIRDQDVAIYAAHEADDGACSMFSNLPLAPSDLQTKFTSAGKSRNDKTFIVGLFIPKDSQDVASSQARAMIAMREDASRWTLVHEFSHFLFDTDFRRTGGEHTDALKNRYTESINAYNAASRAYQRTPNQVNFTNATEKMQAAYKASREIVLRYWAEEMAIETLLRNGVYTSELQFLPFEKRSSYYYIYSSGQAALKELGKFNNELDHLLTEAADQRYWADYDKLTILRSDLSIFKHKITEQADDARSQYQESADKAGVKQFIPPCQHLREADALTNGTKLGAEQPS